MGDASISIKMGTLEINYSGSSDFISEGLLELVKNLAELKPVLADMSKPQAPSINEQPANNSLTKVPSMSTNTIATILDAKTGPDLIMSAAANLTFSQGKDTFSRSDIITEMKAAPSFFKETYIGNLTGSLTSLMSKDKLRLISNNVYAISNKEKIELEVKLAEQK